MVAARFHRDGGLQPSFNLLLRGRSAEEIPVCHLDDVLAIFHAFQNRQRDLDARDGIRLQRIQVNLAIGS